MLLIPCPEEAAPFLVVAGPIRLPTGIGLLGSFSPRNFLVGGQPKGYGYQTNFIIIGQSVKDGVFLILTSSNKMVTPAIKKIREVEKDCQKKLNEAYLQAEAIIQDALKRKIELIAQAKKETQKTMEELAMRAEEDARRESKKITDKEREEIKKLKEKVKPRFHKSLSRILKETGIQLK